LSPEEARAFCDAESECAGVSETSNAGWLATFPGMQSPGRLVLNSNAEWSSCVKEAVLGHRPQYGYCADGYTLQVGKILSNWGSCSGTRGAGYCILSPEEARAFCDAESECAGVSETSNAGWLATFPGMQSPGRLVLNSNAEWSSCVKGTNAPSPSPTPRPSEAPPTSPPTAPPTTPPTAPPTAPPTGPCKKKCEALREEKGDWVKACRQTYCSGCAECQGVIAGRCTNACYTTAERRKSWWKSCAKKQCSGCPECSNGPVARPERCPQKCTDWGQELACGRKRDKCDKCEFCN